jgi:uncharacterized repeat protein (TIGR04042 family)
MPEMHVVVRWPDDSIMDCYSPSLVIREYLELGASYSVVDFLERSRTALGIASERVREKFGTPCTLAARQLEQIETKARAFDGSAGAVRVESYRE